jgi:hypothetical protein
MSSGKGLSSCKSNLSGRIITWFYAEEDRKKKYLEARSVAAEILADEMLEIADGELDDDNPLPEDIARSKLKIETRRFLIGVNNRTRFGTESKVEVNVNLYLT